MRSILIPVVRLAIAWCCLQTAAIAQPQGFTPPDPLTGVPKNNDYFMSRHEAYKARGKEGPIGVLFMGDSITEYWKGQQELWTTFWGQYNPANFAISGDLAQNVIWRIENGELDGISPKVAVLMIGTNNTGFHTADQIVAANQKIIQMTRERLPNTKILLLGLLPRGPWKLPNGEVDKWEARMEVIGDVNIGLEALADSDPMITWLDMTEAFSDAKGRAREELYTDWLHPSAAGFQIWGEEMAPVLARLMRE